MKKALKQDMKIVDGQVMPPTWDQTTISDQALLELYCSALSHSTEGWGKPQRAWEVTFNLVHKEILRRMGS